MTEACMDAVPLPIPLNATIAFESRWDDFSIRHVQRFTDGRLEAWEIVDEHTEPTTIVLRGNRYAIQLPKFASSGKVVGLNDLIRFAPRPSAGYRHSDFVICFATDTNPFGERASIFWQRWRDCALEEAAFGVPPRVDCHIVGPCLDVWMCVLGKIPLLPIFTTGTVSATLPAASLATGLLESPTRLACLAELDPVVSSVADLIIAWPPRAASRYYEAISRLGDQ